jgi:site-specific recombinase XerC
VDKQLIKDLDEYLLYLQVEKNLSLRTIQEYKMDLNLDVRNHWRIFLYCVNNYIRYNTSSQPGKRLATV